MRKMLLLAVGLAACTWSVLGGEYLRNDSGGVVTGLRVVFSEPVRLTGFGDVLTLVTPRGESESFSFSGGLLLSGQYHWMSWRPADATIASYEWTIGTFDSSLVGQRGEHDPIEIMSDDDFTKAGSGVVSGTGTQGDPYVIDGWVINRGDSCILVMNTTKPFVIRNCELSSTGNGILIVSAANGLIANWTVRSSGDSSTGACVSRNACGDGICLYASHDITVDSNLVFDCAKSGISLYGSRSCVVTGNLTSRNGAEGVELSRNSDRNTVTGNWIDQNGALGLFGLAITCDSCSNTVADNTFSGDERGAIDERERCEAGCVNEIVDNEEL